MRVSYKTTEKKCPVCGSDLKAYKTVYRIVKPLVHSIFSSVMHSIASIEIYRSRVLS
ncbi:MAG: hypothetical protein M1481_02975 [Candidatus Thermoplasmatota archaeon]|jgi:C4-type Zn-finger protein|nr:hypothetical protein [Candidatus Thermoplasmatota archaeon]MCL5964021.1 hypothetical protein [Candidatus Thermoplasmatota archaeon]